MIAFSSARDALRCATAVQRALAAHAERDPDHAVRVRIGLHTGEVLKDQDDFFGRNVVLAARIGAAAQGGEILVSSVLKSLVESTGSWAFEDERDLELKGLAGTHRVFALRQEPAPALS
jgi:class 3 adenylate cyclase